MGDMQYLKEGEVSKLTGLALSTLRNYRQQGKGPVYVKVGRAVRYPSDEITRFMNRRRIEPGADR